MYRNYSLKYLYELFVVFCFLIILDQSTKIFVAKIMIDNNFQNINIFPFLDIYVDRPTTQSGNGADVVTPT